MKLRLLIPSLGLALSLMAVPYSFAQDKQAEEESNEPTAEEHEKQDATEEKEAATKIQKMMKVFKSLEGEWVGKEKMDYNNDIPGYKNKPDIEWNDTWKGYYTMGGTYFEMQGETSGKLSSSYHWMVTYSARDEAYRAWSFGSTGFSEFFGELSDDGKSVLWTKSLENEAIEDTFELRADGDKCKASGETTIKQRSGPGINFATQNSSYTRKKVEI